MTIGKLELCYHPALEKMKFRRWENGGWTDVDPNASILFDYIGEKKAVILQNLGNEFFDTIAKSMDGIREITINFKGTKLDYGDFKEMVNYYNKQGKNTSFSIGEFIELKDMESLYQDVILFSYETTTLLQNASKKDALTEALRKELEERNRELNDKKQKLDINAVKLCFVGTYSSGKSTLINAILGYEILPEALKSETAKMFRISHVEKDTDSSISFAIRTKDMDWRVELRWDADHKRFFFITDIQENNIRRNIQECINKNCDKPLHAQLRLILTEINKQPNFPSGNDSEGPSDYVKGIVAVGFPIPLCGDIQFEIYDTPGTDSNYGEHLSILRKALEEQANSILVFVNRPTKLEGTGNGILIQLLNDIEKNGSKSTIDVGRSLYVINAADEIMKGEEGFNDVRNGEIKLQKDRQGEESAHNKNEEKIITLRDKRLFFVSARAAYVARASINKIATQADIKDKKKLHYSIIQDEDAGYYQHNNMALSEYSTGQMREEAVRATNKFRNDEDALFVVNSGLYSLEDEIKKYGSKFSMAVKAKSIIAAIQFIIDEFDAKVSSLEKDMQRDEKELSVKITELRETLTSDIENALNQFKNDEKLDKSDVLPVDIVEMLELTDGARKNLVKKAGEKVKKIHPLGFTGKWTIRDNVKALDEINELFGNYYKNYDEKSNATIQNKVDDFNRSIAEIIKNYESIDDETKTRLLHIPDIEIGDAPDISDRIKIESRQKRYFIVKALDKEGYKDDIEQEVLAQFNRAREIFKDDYKKRLEEICEEMTNYYLKNIDSYSVELEGLRNERDKVVHAIGELNILICEIKNKKNILYDKIWGGKNG
jgi:GTPase SAR1 family protein